MKISVIGIFILTAFISVALAQVPTQTIRGRVIDKDSRTPLTGVSLVIEPSDPMIGAVTGEAGAFRFEGLAVGRYTLRVYYMGYEPLTIPDVWIGAGKETVLEIRMQEAVLKLDEVVVTADSRKGEVINRMASVSARSFSVEETRRYAGSFNDPARMASAYAGVSCNPDGSNDIVIRGNSPRGLLWRLEGIEVPNPNHFAEEGATGGHISILNSTMMSNSDFFSGAFPAEYGNAYSGVFDIRMRKGNNEKREYSFQGGIVGTDLSLEGPFRQGGLSSYLVNYRYSTLAIMNAIGIKIVGDAVPEFQDVSFNLHLPTERMGVFSVFGLGGINHIEEGEELYTNDFGTGMGVLGVTNTFFIDQKTYIRSVVALTGSRNKWTYRESDPEGTFSLKGREDFVYMNSRESVTLHRKFSPRHVLQAGIIHSHMTFDLFSDFYEQELGRMETAVDDRGHTNLMQGYLSWKYRLTDRITLHPGVHCMHFLMNGNTSIEPRLGMQWEFIPGHILSAGFGIHSKAEPPSLYLAQYTLDDGSTIRYNENLGFTKARHYVMGYEHMLSAQLMLRTEVYYQDLYNVPIIDSANSTFSGLNYDDGYTTDPLTNKGAGTNYGIDLTLERFFSSKYYFLITSSLYDSKYVAGDGRERGTRYNGHYTLNILGGKEFGLGQGNKARTVTISIRGTWAGGRRYTPIDLEESRRKGYTVRFDDRAFEAHAPGFMRFDLKVSLLRNKKKATRVWELDIQNVTNRLNMAGDYYDHLEDEIVTYSQLGILPTLSYRIEF
ncbi:MAG: TonB-dependent receptor [Bacteroidales bacterium]|nr:TonB-dependent receptor [Bacteroidales bacterium]